MQQFVRQATRCQYLLDLVISDIKGVKVKVLPRIADHAVVMIKINAQVPKAEVKERSVWRYKPANWDDLRRKLAEKCWDEPATCAVDEAACKFTDEVLEAAFLCIPKGKLREKRSQLVPI